MSYIFPLQRFTRTLIKHNILLTIIIIACCTCALEADVLLSTESSHVCKNLPDTNTGSAGVIELTPNASVGRNGYIRWDLSNFPTFYAVTEGKIKLKKAYSFNNGTQTIKLYKVLSAWDESTTWNTRPTVDTDNTISTLSYVDNDQPGKKYTFTGQSLIDLVQSWVNGTVQNRGMQIQQTSQTGVLSMYTNEASANLQPTLKVTWGGTVHSYTATTATYVAKLYPDHMYGTQTHMDITSHSNTLYSYLTWDLSSIPNGTVIESVSCEMYRAYGFHNTQATIMLFEPDDDWDENTITWNNQPYRTQATPLATVTFYDSDPQGMVYEFSGEAVRALLEGWINETISNRGIRVEQSQYAGVIAFYSDDEVDMKMKPELIVSPNTFELPTPSLTTLTVDARQVIEPVNRKVMGVCLMNPNPSFATTDFINAFTNVFDGISGRAWATQLTQSYWDGFWPFVTGVNFGQVNAINTNGVLGMPAYYSSSTDNNLNSAQQPESYAQLAHILINNWGLNISGWEVWNEPQVPNNGAWPSMDFSRYIADCAEALRTYVPGLRVGAPLYETDQQWNHAFLTAMANESANRRIDFAVTHPYDFAWQKSQENMGSYYARVSGSEYIRHYLIEPKIDLINQIQPGLGLVASEWNTHPSDYGPPYNVSSDMATAINAAATFGVFWDEGVESAQFFQFSTAEDAHFGMVHQSPNALAPAGMVFKLYGQYFRGDRLVTQSNTSTYSYLHPYKEENLDVPLIITHAAYDEQNERICIMLANRHIDSNADVQINLQHFMPESGTATLISITSDNPESRIATQATNDGFVIPYSYNPSFTVTLAPHSVVGVIVSGKRSTVIPVICQKLAMVQEAHPTFNYGAASSSQIVNWPAITNYTLMTWDISPFVGQTILDAQISVHKKYDFAYTQSTLNLYKITGLWSEGELNGQTAQGSEITWNYQPTIDDNVLSTCTIIEADPDGTPYTISGGGLTDLVASWVDGQTVNHGIELKMASPGVFAIYSDDNTANQPVMLLTVIE